MKVLITAASTLALVVGLAGSATAMGSGDDYADYQVGVTYTVYEPASTAGLKLTSFEGRTDCPAGTEAPFTATYGRSTGAMFIVEEGNPMCSDIGEGATVFTFKLRGRTARVVAYCDPADVPHCTKGDVAKYGGHVEVMQPRRPGLRPTRVWIETWGGTKYLTWRQLVAVARSLDATA